MNTFKGVIVLSPRKIYHLAGTAAHVISCTVIERGGSDPSPLFIPY